MTKFGFDPNSMGRIVWVTDQGTNIVKALQTYTQLDCQDLVLNTVLKHGLDIDDEMQLKAPDIAETLDASRAVVR